MLSTSLASACDTATTLIGVDVGAPPFVMATT
jgi:hypothetical protein